MKRPETDPLAAWADRALHQLPPPRSPAGLSPQILKAVRLRARRPWYRRPWPDWPLPGQLSSLALMLGLVGGLAWLSQSAPESAALAGLRTEAAVRLGWLAALPEAFSTLGRAGVLILKQLGSPYMLALIALAVAAWTSCLGLGTAVWRLAHPNR